ncbi:MAG: hypothetical protein KBT87_05965 [Gammaproteobacteria bacterium]|nr:hypothetical protein [Gammaproteobacteria bacterium]MBQ0774200.1 hypothetical protein [Gammaproteobacteria bacterium]
MKSVLNRYLGIHCRVEDGIDGFYISDQIALFQRSRNGSVLIKEVSGGHCDMAFHHDSLWLKCGDGRSRSLDGECLNAPQYLAAPQVVGSGWVVGSGIDENFSCYAACYDVNSRDEVSLPTEGYGALDANGRNIVSCYNGRLSVYDMNFNRIWSLDFDYRNLHVDYSISRKPYICGDDVVVNLGIEGGKGRIICASVSAGLVKWSLDYEGEDIFSFVRNDMLFVSQKSGIRIICVKTGETLKRIDVSFDWPFIAYPCLGGFLVYGADQAYFTGEVDGLTKESVMIPEGYSILVRSLPVTSSGSASLYLKTKEGTLSPALSGSLILSRGNSKDSCLTEDLAAMFMEVADKHGEKTYILTISEPDLDRLIRLGSIKLLEICCTYGEHTFGTGGLRDKQHKGKIKVVIDREGLPDNAEESLAHWISSIKKYLRSMAIFPGAGERYKFQIDVELN